MSLQIVNAYENCSHGVSASDDIASEMTFDRRRASMLASLRAYKRRRICRDSELKGFSLIVALGSSFVFTLKNAWLSVAPCSRVCCCVCGIGIQLSSACCPG